MTESNSKVMNAIILPCFLCCYDAHDKPEWTLFFEGWVGAA